MKFLLITLLRLKRKILGNKDNTVIILPPATIGSLGDEAILKGLVDYMGDRVKNYGIITYGKESYTRLSQKNLEYIDLGQFLFEGTFMGRLKSIWHLSRFNAFYCLGADVLDGFYSESASCRRLELARIAAKLGLAASIIGFSFNDRKNTKCIDAFKTLSDKVRLCSRDEASRDRLSSAIGRDVIYSGDTAFFLKPEASSKEITKLKVWVENKKQEGKLLLGVNINALHKNNFTSNGVQEMAGRYTEVLRRLKEQDDKLCFIFMSHDSRGEINDLAMARVVYEQLSEAAQKDSYIVPDTCGSAEIKAACGLLDVVFTGRFHLAVACMGQGTPVSMVDYQGKVQSLCEKLNIANTIIPMDALVAGEQIYKILQDLIYQRETLQKDMKNKLPDVLALVRRNFNGVSHE